MSEDSLSLLGNDSADAVARAYSDRNCLELAEILRRALILLHLDLAVELLKQELSELSAGVADFFHVLHLVHADLQNFLH